MPRLTFSLIGFALILFFLSAGQSIILPFLTAVFLWYLMTALATYYRKIIPVKKIAESKIFYVFSLILSMASVVLLGLLFIKEVNPALNLFLSRLPDIQFKITMLANVVSEYLHMSNPIPLPDISHFAKEFGIYITQAFSSIGMVLVYILFLFIEQHTFSSKFDALFSTKSENKKASRILNDINDNMKKYLFVKTIMSFITAVLCYLVMAYFDLDFAGFFAFLIFITNYIPTFGAFIGFSLPIVYSLLQFSDLTPFIFITSGLILIQIVIGNIIEPKYTGKTLNLSTLAILINLVFWGIIWGPIGMFFSVPLLVALFIITAQFDSTRPIAILLSSNGEIPDKEDD